MRIDSKINQNFYKPRPYQEEAIESIVEHTKDHMRNTLSWESLHFNTAALIEMATWSGKTFVTWKALDSLLKFRNTHNHYYNTQEYRSLNILVLTNRIDGLNQFRDDLVYGREETQAAFLSQEVLKNTRIQTFHSKADNLDDISKKYWTQNEKDENKTLWNSQENNKDTFFFSTFQTAILKNIADKIPYIDMIIIDEAHNVKKDSEYEKLLLWLKKLQRNNKEPIILPITATPTNITKELFWEPIFEYWLPEYLASSYSPSVDYKLITSSQASAEEILDIQEQVEEAKKIENIREKRKQVKLIEEQFEKIMSSYANTSELTQDLIEKRIWKDPKQTIIYANTIEEADSIAKEINKQLKKEIAVPYHSSNDNKMKVDWSKEPKTYLARFSSPLDEIKIIIAIGKLNESVDVPTVENVVFWRQTDVERIFLQQFWRWLRWDGTTTYFDYACWIKNFSWIWQIQEKVSLHEPEWWWGTGFWMRRSKFNIDWDDVFPQEHWVDLNPILFDFANLQNETERNDLTLEEIQDFFFNYVPWDKEKSYEKLMKLSKKEIYEIELDWNKIFSIGTKSRWKSNSWFKVLVYSWFKEFISWLFQKTYIEEKENISLNEIQDFFFNYVPQDKEKSYQKLMKLSTNEIQEIELDWNKISNIATRSGWKSNSWFKVIVPSWFKEFISWLFQEDFTQLSLKQIQDFFFNYVPQDKEKSYEKLIKFSAKEIQEIKFNWHKIISIATKSGWKSNNWFETDTISWFKEFISWLFQKDFTQLSLKQIQDFFFNYVPQDKEKSYQKLMKLSKKKIYEIELYWNKISSIGTKSGRKSDNWFKIDTISWFKEFISSLFQKEFTQLSLIQIQEFLFNYVPWDKEKSYQELRKLSVKEIRNMKLFWHKTAYIATKSGWQWGDIRTNNKFKEFISRLFQK